MIFAKTKLFFQQDFPLQNPLFQVNCTNSLNQFAETWQKLIGRYFLESIGDLSVFKKVNTFPTFKQLGIHFSQKTALAVAKVTDSNCTEVFQ